MFHCLFTTESKMSWKVLQISLNSSKMSKMEQLIINFLCKNVEDKGAQ